MAVVYADLRFTRASNQITGVTQEQNENDWDLTYENVTIPKQRKKQTKCPKTCPRGFWTLPHFVTITLILLSCTLISIIIGLSVRLSQVSERHLNTAAKLQQLQGEHEDLGSRFTQNNLKKDSMVQMLKENQRQTQQELEKTKALLTQMQEKWKTTTQELQRTIRENEETKSTLSRLQGTENELGEVKKKLSQCEINLRSVTTQKRTSDTEHTKTKNILQTTQKQLRSTESTLLLKDKELSDVKRNLLEAQNKLVDNMNYTKQQKKSLSDLEQRLSDLEQRRSEAGECLTNTICSQVLNVEKNAEDAFDYCPPTWHQIGELCYFFSSQKKVRIDAEEDCSQRSASLARVEVENSILTDLIKRTHRSYWIGLHKGDTSWQWSDKTIKNFSTTSYQNCAKASPRVVAEQCKTLLPWICETRAKTCGSMTDALRCLGEKIGVFGEKLQKQEEK
ncbi:uncharacterized protein LOC142670902 [Rhinoderma darwinii]|uniref:uncharacterized protein LOC142670902 n=1 Tax=Rhinoderma darwinii TaxID=43563 RepID=UPI003F669CF6